MKTSYAVKLEAKKNLKTIGLRDGDTVYCILRHTSTSGMQRCISLVLIKNGEPRTLDYNAQKLLELRGHKRYEGVIIGGCGMDMGFALVDYLREAMGFKSLKHQWL